MAVGFGLELCLQPSAHPLPAFGFHRQFHLAQGARPVQFRVHPNYLSFEGSSLGEEPFHPHYAHIMVRVSNRAPLMVLPSLIVGNELVILVGVGAGVGIWFLAHRHGQLRGVVESVKR